MKNYLLNIYRRLFGRKVAEKNLTKEIKRLEDIILSISKYVPQKHTYCFYDKNNRKKRYTCSNRYEFDIRRKREDND